MRSMVDAALSSDGWADLRRRVPGLPKHPPSCRRELARLWRQTLAARRVDRAARVSTWPPEAQSYALRTTDTGPLPVRRRWLTWVDRPSTEPGQAGFTGWAEAPGPSGESAPSIVLAYDRTDGLPSVIDLSKEAVLKRTVARRERRDRRGKQLWGVRRAVELRLDAESAGLEGDWEALAEVREIRLKQAREELLRDWATTSGRGKEIDKFDLKPLPKVDKLVALSVVSDYSRRSAMQWLLPGAPKARVGSEDRVPPWRAKRSGDKPPRMARDLDRAAAALRREWWGFDADKLWAFEATFQAVRLLQPDVTKVRSAWWSILRFLPTDLRHADFAAWIKDHVTAAHNSNDSRLSVEEMARLLLDRDKLFDRVAKDSPALAEKLRRGDPPIAGSYAWQVGMPREHWEWRPRGPREAPTELDVMFARRRVLSRERERLKAWQREYERARLKFEQLYDDFQRGDIWVPAEAWDTLRGLWEKVSAANAEERARMGRAIAANPEFVPWVPPAVDADWPAWLRCGLQCVSSYIPVRGPHEPTDLTTIPPEFNVWIDPPDGEQIPPNTNVLRTFQPYCRTLAAHIG